MLGYIGFALGPAVGAALIQRSGGETSSQRGAETVTAVFWVAVCCSFINILLLLFIFPESLSVEKRLKARTENGKGKARASGSSTQDENTNDSNISHESPDSRAGILVTFLRPLGIFLPARVQFEVPGRGVQTKRDWSLTWLALALFGYMLSTGLFQIKYLYAEHVYGWGAQQVGVFL
jgi:MFS family permease